MQEKSVSAEDIVSELLPLIKDYFVAECLSYGNVIEMMFSGGQKIKITVEA